MADKNNAPVIFCPHLSKCKRYTQLSSDSLAGMKLYCMVTGQVVCEKLAQSCIITATHSHVKPTTRYII